MDNILLILKKLLNSIDDEELKEFDLWINNSEQINFFVVEDKDITLITYDANLKINDRDW